jgi:hypothetical protein
MYLYYCLKEQDQPQVERRACAILIDYHRSEFVFKSKLFELLLREEVQQCLPNHDEETCCDYSCIESAINSVL